MRLRCLWPKGWTLLACKDGTQVWVPKRCRRCTPCRRAYKRKVIAKIIHGLKDENWFSFGTFTSKPDMTWPRMMTAFTRLVAHLRLSQPQLQYVAVKEEGSLHGMKHLHVIFHGWVWHSYADLQATWLRLTGAHDVNIKRKPGEAAAAYAAKYVGKGNVSAIKVVTFSSKWAKLPPQDIWHVVQWESRPGFVPPTTLEDADGALVERYDPKCYHLIEVKDISIATLSWLKSLQAHSWHPPPVASES